ATVAALYAAVLTAADLAVVLPNARSYLAGHWALDAMRGHGPVVQVQTLADPSVWATTLSVAVDVSLFAIIGAGLATLAGRWWLVGSATGLLAVESLLYLAKDELPAQGPMVVLILLATVLAIPAAPWGLFWWANVGGAAPLAVV